MPKNLQQMIEEKLKELKDRELGCCGGDFCPVYNVYGENYKDIKGHDDYLESFLRQALRSVATEAVEACGVGEKTEVKCYCDSGYVPVHVSCQGNLFNKAVRLSKKQGQAFLGEQYAK